MVNRSGNRGTAAETAVVNYLRGNGFPTAERRRLRGAEDWGDLTGTPGICWEVKGGDKAKDALEASRGTSVRIGTWLGETERERLASRSDVGLLVVQRRGTTDAGRWWCVLDATVMATLVLAEALEDAEDLPGILRHTATQEPEPVRVELQYVVRWLRAAGYGDPLSGEELDQVLEVAAP